MMRGKQAYMQRQEVLAAAGMALSLPDPAIREMVVCTIAEAILQHVVLDLAKLAVPTHQGASQ